MDNDLSTLSTFDQQFSRLSPVNESGTFLIEEQPASKRVYYLAETLYKILNSSSFASIVAVGHSDRYSREVTYAVLRSRIRRRVTKFVPEESYEKFMKLLHETRSIFYRSSALAVISPKLFAKHNLSPTNFSLVTPIGLFEKWKFFFYSIGYLTCKGIDIKACIGGVRRKAWLSGPDNGLKIFLVESLTESTLPPIITLPSTCEMNAISSTRIYCFYPKLTAKELCLRSFWRMVKLEKTPGTNKTFQWYTEDWKKCCEETCPARWRRTYELWNVGEYVWGGLPNQALKPMLDLSGFRESHHKWKLADECRNRNCPFKKFHDVPMY